MTPYLIYFYDLDNLDRHPVMMIFHGSLEEAKNHADSINPYTVNYYINIFDWNEYYNFDHENDDCEPVAQKSRAYHLESEPIIWIKL